jgi:anti-sigma B factor antagonist
MERLRDVASELEVVAEAGPLGEGAYVIGLAGELDLYTGTQFEGALLEALRRGASEVVVDLTDVSFIDSTTLGILMRARKRLLALKGRLVLVCIDENILKLLHITTLDRMFEIYATREQAMRALDGGAAA